MSARKTFLSLLCLAALAAVRPASAQSYKITDLGTLGGGQSVAYGINSLDQVVGNSHLNSQISHAFLWLPSSAYGFPAGMIDLGTLPAGGNSTANGINDVGQVVGYSGPANGNDRPFLWTNTRGMKDIGTLSADSFGFAYSINASGQILGYCSNFNGDPHQQACLWNGSTITDLGTLGGSASTSFGGLNDAGQAVGIADLSNGVGHAFLWNAEGGMSDLGILRDGTESFALGVNSSEQVCGFSLQAGDLTHAFIWLPTPTHGLPAGMTDLGTLPGGNSSQANAINDNFQIVGSADGGDGTMHAIIVNNGAMYDLNTLIKNSNWALNFAYAINNGGRIVGGGLIGGQFHAFLLTPPVLKSLTIKPSIVTSGTNPTGTVKLTIPAPPGGAVVSLSSSNPAVASVPPSVLVTQGKKGAKFSITTGSVSGSTVVTITASYNGVTKTAMLTVNP